MRFAEFKLLFEEKQKIYAIGDSHANAIGSAGKFINLSTDGRSAFSPENDSAISQVQPNSVVVLSAGANNMLDPNKASVVGRIENLINKLKQKKCTVYYVLFAETDNPKFAKDRNQLRSIVASAIGAEVGVLDMGKLHYDPKTKQDGIHADANWYKNASAKVASGAKDYAPQQADQGAKPATAKVTLEIPQGRVGTEVADVQKALLALGYKLPKYGVDGIRGPETSRAVSQFQQDYNLSIDGDPGPQTVGMLNKVMTEKGITIEKSTEADVKRSQAEYRGLDDEDVKKYSSVPTDQLTSQARQAAEDYLGRPMSDLEWDWLVRATGAESAFNVKSYAMVMATMLNHARTYAPKAKNGVIVALKRKNAFQAVTGTSADGNRPSPNFERGPNAKQVRAINVGAIQFLSKVPHSQMEFSATNPAAYGAGTNIGWLRQLEKNPNSSVIAGSRFNTTMTA